MPSQNHRKIFDDFKKLRIMVIGDVMVDSYIFGKVDRISPEAPVPVVRVEKRINRLGGAANVALNLRALGAEVMLCSVIGHDRKAEEFMELLSQENLTSQAIIKSHRRITTTKFRVIGNNTQMLRVDEEITSDLDPVDEKMLIDKVNSLLESKPVHAVIFQDYNKGVLTPELIRIITGKANDFKIPVIVDPKKKNFRNYQNVTLFKPNLKELKEGLNMEINPDDAGELEKAADMLHRDQQVKMVMTTLSESGVFISRYDPDKGPVRWHIPAHIRAIADVSGAGDTVVSVAALCLAAGLEPRDIAAISNLAGGLVCEEVGVVPVNRDKLLKQVEELL